MPGNDMASQASTYASARDLYFRPPAYIAENFSRNGTPVANPTVAPLSTGRELCVSIFYQKGQPVTSIGFHTATTAGATITNWWMALRVHDVSPFMKTKALTSVTVTSGATTFTGTGFTPDMAGRLVTGTGITGGTYIAAYNSSTSMTLSANASSTSTSTKTLGLYNARSLIAVSANQTGALPATTETALALANVITIPATGLYYNCMMVQATTVPTLLTANSGSGGGTSTLAFLGPALQGTHSTGLTTVSTAPNPAPSLTALTCQPYTFAE